MVIVGIDPGKSGAAVAIDSNLSLLSGHSLMWDKAGLLDAVALASWFWKMRPGLVVIEKVYGRGAVAGSSFKGWGASQNFNFGFGFGQIVQAVRCLQPAHGFGFGMVPSQTWQKDAHAGRPRKMSAKDSTAWAYGSLYPNGGLPTKPRGGLDDGMIDALFIARWGATHLCGQQTVEGKP
jgi:hypothetical protein